MEYKFFLAAHGILSKIDILRHKAILNKYKETEMNSCILLDHCEIKLEINSKRYYRKYSNTWRLNNILLKK
jgi:hypothetical protein